VDRSLAPGLDGERRAVVAGIVLGEDEGLDQVLRDDFRASGLYHLLSKSTKGGTLSGLVELRRSRRPKTRTRVSYSEGTLVGMEFPGQMDNGEARGPLRQSTWAGSS
jgi:hypothetical protein